MKGEQSELSAALGAEKSSKSNAIEIPSVTLPKGGGALKGIDEKFEVNSANGTAKFSIPLPLTPGRNGATPSLSISYNSGGGNGSFGLGWSLDSPTLQRQTDKNIPQYKAGSEEDSYMLSGAEDLVPYLEKDPITDEWIPKVTTVDGYTIRTYRPRIEGTFARIENITRGLSVYWKVTAQDNTVTFFGRTTASRVADAKDTQRIFQWLPEFSADDKGNWIRYHYKIDSNIDSNGVTVSDASIPNHCYERNRKDGTAPYTNTYLKRVTYGNHQAYDRDASNGYDFAVPEEQIFFELIFDYGEHDVMTPTPDEVMLWANREDAFSSYRAGFEIRTNRLCKRILMFHHFPEETQFTGTRDEASFGKNYLVRSLDLTHTPSSINNSRQAEVVYLTAATQNGYIRKQDGSYSKKSLPPMEFSYQALEWNKEIITVSEENSIHAPVGLANSYQWVDLYGEGISGILSEQGTGWFYKSNLGDVSENGNVVFGVAKNVFPRPSLSGLTSGVLSIQDLENNGQKQVVVRAAGVAGYFELCDEEQVKGFHAFEQSANVNLQNPNFRLLDLTGDGTPDLVLTDEHVFTWYASEGKQGYAAHKRSLKAVDEEDGPTIVFSDAEQSVFLADMSGDGLTDLVRIRNGEICYWANMGYGKFSAKITMANAPRFDYPERFNPRYLHLADVSGTGATDIIYLGENLFKAYINLSGNAWSNAHQIESFLSVDDHVRVSVVDLLGTGTPCIVWSSDLPGDRHAPMRYIDLMSSKKPHVLVGYKNNLGKETTLEYKSSTHYYIKDKLAGTPWITKLPFPVQVVSKQTVEEKITNVKFSSEFRYHHGYYDAVEKEFRGFGMVEQIDAEFYLQWRKSNGDNQLEKDDVFFQQPVLTKTWFHTGAYLERNEILACFKKEFWFEEYNRRFTSSPLIISEPTLSDVAITAEVKALAGEALRACKGMMLRQEIFSLDGENGNLEALKKQAKPYSVTTHNCQIQLIQPRGDSPYAVFMVTETEAISIQYERNESDPRIAHTINTKIDELGNVLEVASIVYPRRQVAMDLPEDIRIKQAQLYILYGRNQFTNDIRVEKDYRLRVVAEVDTFDITGLSPSGELFQREDFENILTTASIEIQYHQDPNPGAVQRRLIERVRTLYRQDDLTGPLPFGILESKGIRFESYQLAYTPELLQAIYGDKLPTDTSTLEDLLGDNDSDGISSQGKFVHLDDNNWWIRSGTIQLLQPGEALADVQRRFYLPSAYTDPFGAITTVSYWKDYYLFIETTTDAVGNQATVERINFRTLTPSRKRDLNDNITEVLQDERGLVKAVAVMGKGNEADDLIALTEITDDAEEALIKTYFTLSDTEALRTTARQLLQQASSRFVYDFDRYQTSVTMLAEQLEEDPGTLPCALVKLLPTVVGNVTREQHHSANQNSLLQLSFEYSDGAGNVAMVKSQTQPGDALSLNIQPNCQYSVETIDTSLTNQLRWIGNGRKILNNKGNPVKQYEPYYSVTPFYEDAKVLVERGVSPLFYYDSVGRNIRTALPDGTFTKVEFDAWQQTTYDASDTVRDSAWFADHGSPDPEGAPPSERNLLAAWKSAQHANTPATVHLDSLGRPVLSVAHNRVDGVDEFYTTTIHLDIEGNTRAVVDHRGNVVMAYKYDLLGHRVYLQSMDAGERWMLNNVAGNSLRAWDSRNHIFSTMYDRLQRPLETRVQGGDADTPLNHVVGKVIYGEDQPDDKLNNLRGQTVQVYDTAGKVSLIRFDFKGNLLEKRRQLTADYKQIPDWSTNNLDILLENEIFTSSSTYDALNRITANITPDGSVTTPGYNDAGLLTEVQVQQGDEATTFVRDIRYNEKRQRTAILYGNNVQTTYTYDPKSFRPIQVISRKQNNELLQELFYTYDAVGNITEIEDRAIPTIFFGNHQVEPKCLYTYDAVSRLVHAAGREHIAQVDFGGEDNWNDLPFLKRYSPNDPLAWRNYEQRYQYDGVGNILQMRHQATGGGWTRDYEYETDTNRLIRTTTGNQTYLYPHHDAHGFITQMPHLASMRWNFMDELQATSRQVVNTGIPETTYYVYDGSGQRVRKVTENEGGRTRKDERIYIDGIEIYRKHSGTDAGLERTTLHVSDSGGRIAMVDTRNGVNDDTDRRSIRYQMSNHLGSATLELTGDANPRVINYEEYHPYGTTSYQAVNADIRIASKRYRYTGMERDDETGLSYHSARYYVTWLGRWLSSDPIGIGDGVNLYGYASNNPIRNTDVFGKASDPPDDDDHQNPRLMKTWPYSEPVPNRQDVGHRVEKDHCIQVSLRAQQRGRTGTDQRKISRDRGELTVLVETGRGYFHTEVGKLQAEIRERYRAGLITSESQLIEETRAAYELAGEITKTVVDPAALDAAIISNLGVMSETYEETRRELSEQNGPTTVTETTIDEAFADTPESEVTPSEEPLPLYDPTTELVGALIGLAAGAIHNTAVGNEVAQAVAEATEPQRIRIAPQGPRFRIDISQPTTAASKAVEAGTEAEEAALAEESMVTTARAAVITIGTRMYTFLPPLPEKFSNGCRPLDADCMLFGAGQNLQQ